MTVIKSKNKIKLKVENNKFKQIIVKKKKKTECRTLHKVLRDECLVNMMSFTLSNVAFIG